MYIFWHNDGGLMLMPQGKDEKNWLDAFKKMLEVKKDEVPRHFTDWAFLITDSE